MSDAKATGKRHCYVAECDNDERYPGRLVIRGHVDKYSSTWHRIPKGDAVVEKSMDEADSKRQGQFRRQPRLGNFRLLKPFQGHEANIK